MPVPAARNRPIRLAVAFAICFLVFEGAIAPARSGGAEPKTIEAWLGKVRREQTQQRHQWSVLVRDLETGRTVLELNPDQRLIPASNRKLVTFAMAMDKLGPEFRFRTELGSVGRFDQASGILNGSLVLRSNGDPTLSSRYLNQKNPVSVLRGWIAAVAGRGIRRVTGDFVIDASAFGPDQGRYPAVWDPRHKQHAYAPLSTAIALNKNLIRISVRASSSPGYVGNIRIYPSDEGLNVINETRSTPGRSQSLEAEFGAGSSNLLYVRGRVGKKIRTHVVSLPMADPLEYIRAIVEDALHAEGVEIDGSVRVIRDPRAAAHLYPLKTFIQSNSIPLFDLALIMLRDSENFFAEQIWRTTAWRATGRGDANSARRLEAAWLADRRLESLLPGFDGSGLSRENSLSATNLVALLTTFYHSPYRRYLIECLPESGRSGTLRHRSLGYKSGRIAAKTGTLSGVSALSGFIRDRAGNERWVFSMIANAPKSTNGFLTRRQNEIMKILLRKLDAGPRTAKSAAARPKIKRYRPGTKVHVRRTP